MIDRRTLLAAGTTALMVAPYLARASANSQTPVVDGKRVRRRLSSLPADDPFFEAYSLAAERMRQEPDTSALSWISQARVHADFCAHTGGAVDLNFFSWHRPYLESFELVCAELIGDPNFALPYWHWSDNQGRLPDAFFDLNPLNTNNWSDDGSYIGMGWGPVNSVNYRYLRKDLGLRETRLGGWFTEQNINSAIGTGNFRNLSRLIEGGPHGNPHVAIGGEPALDLGTDVGHMSDGLSPLEPMFWLHHCMVDFIWAMSGIPVADQLSEIDDPDAIYSGNFVDGQGNPREVRVGDTFDISEQSFTYDTLVPELQTDQQIASNDIIRANQDSIFEIASAQNLFAAATDGLVSDSVIPSDPAGFGLITPIAVPFEGLTAQLTSKQLTPRRLGGDEVVFGISDRRIYAEFDAVKVADVAPAGGLKVFVDCPYLTPATPTTDPHFAGDMSFFGCSPDTCSTKSFLVDVTEPLQYRIAQGSVLETVNLQVLPYDGASSPLGETVADIGEVRLISG
ncbi:tyrosinase family protein [Ruegeria sp. EL01]|jgi:tyrosinase|uniref:tyrosinase family protein n=1 Tax=Ruegeria sp. EL01 TaxID=2107578 RepID=UPI000EA8045D|nr:tyrosinase family protein [Ruegeria sp. EL01]